MDGYELIVLDEHGNLHRHFRYKEYEWDSALTDWLRYQGSADQKVVLTWAGEEFDDGTQ